MCDDIKRRPATRSTGVRSTAAGSAGVQLQEYGCWLGRSTGVRLLGSYWGGQEYRSTAPGQGRSTGVRLLGREYGRHRPSHPPTPPATLLQPCMQRRSTGLRSTGTLPGPGVPEYGRPYSCLSRAFDSNLHACDADGWRRWRTGDRGPVPSCRQAAPACGQPSLLRCRRLQSSTSRDDLNS